MTWDENLLQFQRNYGGTLLGSVASYQPCGLLHTRYHGVDLTLFLTFVQDGKGMVPWSAAAAPAELERPYSLTVKHRNKLVPQGLMADFERCSTGREELDDALYVESDDPEFTKKVFLSPALSQLLPSQKRYQLHVRPVAGSDTLHVVEARTDRLQFTDGQLTGPLLAKPMDEGQMLGVLEHLAALTAAGVDAVTRWRM